MLPYRLAPLLILIAAVIFLLVVLPLGTETVTYGTLSPDSLPKWLAIAVAVLAVIDFLQPSIPTEASLPDLTELSRAALVFCLTLVAVFMMPYIGFSWTGSGFFITSIVLALVTTLLTGERRVQWLLLTSLLIPALIWYVVTWPLERVLP